MLGVRHWCRSEQRKRDRAKATLNVNGDNENLFSTFFRRFLSLLVLVPLARPSSLLPFPRPSLLLHPLHTCLFQRVTRPILGHKIYVHQIMRRNEVFRKICFFASLFSVLHTPTCVIKSNARIISFGRFGFRCSAERLSDEITKGHVYKVFIWKSLSHRLTDSIVSLPQITFVFSVLPRNYYLPSQKRPLNKCVCARIHLFVYVLPETMVLWLFSKA